ncbi:hypothetical protein ACIP46_34480 [Streptomyces lavendulae]|uniref:hypothetical protein n=1 Tax=Streptomyces lavendulae TaxID=1914 RepID=UPI0024A16F0C|nr:hypothetical protein Slala05_77750 [Streptomyces lavendulae subsp. lavendulae]
MAEQGGALHGHALALAQKTRERISRIDGTHVHGRDDFCAPGRAADMDPLQLIIDISAWEVTGYRAADRLRDKHRSTLHIADHRRISAQLTHADDSDTAEVPAVRADSGREVALAGAAAARDAGPDGRLVIGRTCATASALPRTGG